MKYMGMHIFNIFGLGDLWVKTYYVISGVSLGEGSGATMSDDEEELQMDFSLDQSGGDGHDMMGFGPLLPTESERTLMERVRQELKIELKQVDLYFHSSLNPLPNSLFMG